MKCGILGDLLLKSVYIIYNCLFCCTVQWRCVSEFQSAGLCSCSGWWEVTHISKECTVWSTGPMRRKAKHAFKMSKITQSSTQCHIPEEQNPPFHPVRTSKLGETVCVLSNATESNINILIFRVSRTICLDFVSSNGNTKYRKLFNTLVT
jgi:hypothetical protein